MSNSSNTELLELAGEHSSYWAGEGIGAAIDADIERNDLDALSEHLKQSASLIFQLEYNPTELEASDVY